MLADVGAMTGEHRVAMSFELVGSWRSPRTATQGFARQVVSADLVEDDHVERRRGGPHL